MEKFDDIHILYKSVLKTNKELVKMGFNGIEIMNFWDDVYKESKNKIKNGTDRKKENRQKSNK